MNHDWHAASHGQQLGRRRTPAIALAVILACSVTTLAQNAGEPTAGDAGMRRPRIYPPVVLTERGLRVHRAGLLIDGHNDLPWQIREKANFSLDRLDIAVLQPSVQTDLPRLRRGGVSGQFWVVYVDPGTERAGTATAEALAQFDLIHRMIERYDDLELALTADDVERIHADGKIASLIGVEGGHMIQNSLDTLREFHRRGARYMGLTHSENTDWADSATDEPEHGGLTPFGEQVVREMNRLGMLVDIAHVSADTMRDALRVSTAPVIASHSSAYSVARHVRNVPDDVLGMIKRNRGVVMINFFSGYSHPVGAEAMSNYFETERALKARYPEEAAFRKAWRAWKDAHPIPAGTAHVLVDHIDHIVRVAGIDCVGLGSDYDGAGRMPQNMEDVAGYPYLTQALLDRGYNERDIHKIMGGNILRALRAAEAQATTLSGKAPTEQKSQ